MKKNENDKLKKEKKGPISRSNSRKKPLQVNFLEKLPIIKIRYCCTIKYCSEFG